MFDVVLGTDIDQEALATFDHNHRRMGSQPVTLAGDIKRLTPIELGRLLRPWDLDGKGQLDVLVGGPPCEGFSQNKRLEIVGDAGERSFTRNPLDSNDPRNTLFRYFLGFVAEVRPKAVLIENVPQMLTAGQGRFARELAHTFEALGYEVTCRVVNAAAFGVPQLRKRAIVVAVRHGLASYQWPLPTHVAPTVQTPTLFDCFVRPYTTVRDAIADLPQPTSRERGRRPVSEYQRTEHLSFYAAAMRSEIAAPLNHVYRVPGERVLTRLRAMRPGMRTEELAPELRPKSHYYRCYGRLEWDQPAKTITKSCNYLGSGCFGHPEADRGITMREAARLQGFDDDFDFLSASEPHVAKMVGSAVPPLLATALAHELAAVLDPELTASAGAPTSSATR